MTGEGSENEQPNHSGLGYDLMNVEAYKRKQFFSVGVTMRDGTSQGRGIVANLSTKCGKTR